MNEQAMKNYQELIDKLSQDPEAIGLKNEIEELENRLANPDYYRTPNRADGTPAQTGDFGREFNNYSSHIISTIESIRDLLNNSVEELRLNNTNPESLEQLNNVLNDVNTNIEQARVAISDKNTDEASRLITAANGVLENNRDLLSQNIKLEDQAEYNRLMSDRSEEIADHEDFMSRAATLEAKDANGNAYLDRNGRPVVNVNLYNMISDEKKLAKAKEAYANTPLGLLENMISSMGVSNLDFGSRANESVQPTPMDETDIANDMYDKLFGEDADINAPKVDTAKDADTNTMSELEFQDRQVRGEYFEHPKYGKVVGMSNITYKDGTVGIKTQDGKTVIVPLSELKATGELSKDASEEIKAREEKAAAKQEQKKNMAAALKLKLDRSKRWLAKYGKTGEDEKFMDGTALDDLEKYGVYMPGGYKPAEVVEEVEPAKELLIPLPKVKNPEVEMEAMAANEIDANKEEKVADESAKEQSNPEEKVESEMDEMAKGNDKKQTVDGYTESTDTQKQQSKDRLKALKTALLVGVTAIAVVIGGNALLNRDKDTDNNDEYNIENTTDDEIKDEISNEIEDTNKIPGDDKELGDFDRENKDKDDEKDQTAPSTTSVQPTPVTEPVGQVTPVQPSTVTTGGGVTGITEVDTTHYHTAEEIAQAQAAIASGNLQVGQQVPGTGQTVLSQTTTITGGEYTGTTETVVENHEVTPEGVTSTTPTAPADQPSTGDVTNTDTYTTHVSVSPDDISVSYVNSDGETETFNIKPGATSVDVTESEEEVIPDELQGLSSDELNAIAAYQD